MRARWLDAVAVAVLLGGPLYLAVTWRPPARPVVFPAVQVERTARGAERIAVDHRAVQAAFAAAGLPDPPDLNGADPVPVRILLGLAGRWAGERSVRSLGGLAQVYQALEEHRAALGCFAAAARLEPGHARWHYGLGAECQALHLDTAAIEALGRVTELEPDYPTTWARLGVLHLERGELDRAESCFRQFEQRAGPRQALSLVGLGRVALARGDAPAAERWLRQAVERSPNDYMAHRFLARACAKQGRTDEARRHQQIADRLPQYVGWLQFDLWLNESHQLADTQRHLNNMLRLASQAGDWNRSLQFALALSARQPGDWNMLANLSRIYRQLERLDEAEQAIRKALEIEPDNADLRLAFAELVFKRQDWSATQRAIDRVLELDPIHAPALELQSRTQFVQGRLTEAVDSARRALEIEPDRSSAAMMLAVALERSGEREQAVEVLRTLLARDPANEQAKQLLGRLR